MGPVGFTFTRTDVLGPGTKGRMYVALYGPPATPGRTHGKQIIEFELDAKRGLCPHGPALPLRSWPT